MRASTGARATLAALVAGLLCSACTAAVATADPGTTPPAGGRSPARVAASADVEAVSTAATPPVRNLGKGFVVFPQAAQTWVRSHPKNPHVSTIRNEISGVPSSLWLTSNYSFGNLDQDVELARSSDRTMLLTLWNIPLRWDGLSSLSPVTVSQYEAWVSQVATTIGTTRAVIVLEPDSLWFYDRLPNDQDRADRLTAMNYAVSTLRAKAPNALVYLEAGTSSGSVTPQRMAQLLLAAGVGKAAGYAVNVSSYAPFSSIQPYAQAIRAALQASGIADPRYVTDTGRNGAAGWNTDWCNPAQQKLGARPGVLRSTDGRDLNLWVKAPGTSDGDCGAGAGSYGGQFLPNIAYGMTKH